MIVRSINEGWRVVFQPAHGLLAQHLASHLAIESQLPFWPLTRVAIGMHDDGKQAFRIGKRAYLTDAGVPQDFTLMSIDSEDRVKDAQSQIWEATKKHRWIGLLVSLHTDSLYRDQPVADDMRKLLDDESRRRAEVLGQLDVSAGELQRSYDWLRWCDRCSLILSGGDIPAMQRQVEIITCSEGQRYDLYQNDRSVLQVDPWPFSDCDFEVSVESRTLTQLAFDDDHQLAVALQAAVVADTKFKFQRSAK